MTHSEQNTKANIMKSTVKLISRGEVNLSMSQIATEAGVSKSTLYYFFTNKEDLFGQIITHFFQELKERMRKISEENIAPEKKLQKMMNMTVELTEKEGGMVHFTFQQAFTGDHKFLQKIMQVREEVKLYFKDILKEGISQKTFRKVDLEKTSEVIMGFLDFTALIAAFPCHCAQTPPYTTYELCDQLLELLQTEK